MKKKTVLNKKKKGFTLIELIIVMAIMAILAAIAIPKFSAYRNAANKRADQVMARNVANITATLAANGSFTSNSFTNKAISTTDDDTKLIANMLEGGVPKIKTSGHTTDIVYVTLDADGIVTVKIGTAADSATEVYPTVSGDFK